MKRLPIIDAGNLSGPIPGMSLTTEPGNRPWENPPQIVKLEDAVAFYADKLLDPEKQDAILNAFAEDISIESMADMITTSAVMDGIHTIDVSVLINPVVQEMFRYVADTNGVEYVDSYEELEKQKRIPEYEARKIVEEVVKERNEGKVPELPSMSKKEMPEETQPEAPMPRRGLMAKPMSEEV
jgi:hypothetical protein